MVAQLAEIRNWQAWTCEFRRRRRRAFLACKPASIHAEDGVFTRTVWKRYRILGLIDC